MYRLGRTADGERVFTNFEGLPGLQFACEVGRHFDAFVLFGRAGGEEDATPYPLPDAEQLVALPYYSSLRDGRELLLAGIGTVAAMWKGLPRVDVVLVFGPNPFALALVVLALLRRRRVVIGIRQDTMAYFRSRLPSRSALPLLAPLWLLDQVFRLLARRLPTLVWGPYLEQRYGGPRPGLHASRVLLVRARDVARETPEKNLSAPIQLLTVSRIEPEKNPLLLVDALAQLERDRPGGYHLKWAGEGRLRDAVRARATELGVQDRIELLGYIPFGSELLSLYRQAHIFVHVAITEAFGQVLMEAMACATPIIATDVGGVARALDGGAAGWLVPPRDPTALVRAIHTLADDPDARRLIVVRGLELARRHTLEAEATRLARFIRDPASSPRAVER